MAGAFVQSFGNGSGGSNVTTLSVTLSGTTANNLLIAVVCTRAAGNTFVVPSGWTFVAGRDDLGDSLLGIAIYERVSDGAETSVAFNWSGGARAQGLVAEYSGLAATSPREDFAEDESNINSATTSQPTGSATPISANGMGIAILGSNDARDWHDGLTSIDNSYVKDAFRNNSAVAQPAINIASLVYTTTAAQSATWTTSDVGGDGAYGAMLVFKEPAAGGAAIPVFINSYRQRRCS